MSTVSLKKILQKKELPSLLQDLACHLNSAIDVDLLDGTKLVSIGKQTATNRYPIEVSGEIIGWVVGETQTITVATMLSLLAKQETEKRELAIELLERYQEIDLFEDISTQLTTSLDKQQIAQLVLQEVIQLIESSTGVILLLGADATAFEILAEFGNFCDHSQPEPGKGIIGNIVQSGRAELVNDVQADLRSSGQENLNALICVPLRTKERIIGAIAIGTNKTDPYKAEHLKLVSIFASQTAVAIEKALLYEQSTLVAAQAKAQTQRLQQALQDLQLAQTQLIQSEKMSSLGQLIAGVAHEINNPVNFICGNLRHIAEYANDLLYLLQKYQKFLPVSLPELESDLENIDLEFMMQDLPKLLDSMKLGSDRIVEIVKSLKNFSRHDGTQKQAVNIHDGIDGTLMILRHRLKASTHGQAIEIIKDYAELPLIECYPGQLNQVFMNILANAVDALEESMVNGHWSLVVNESQMILPNITIRTEALDEKWVVIRIADNGPGMKEEVIRRIYDPFFTTKEIGKGTGLGMAISHQIVVDGHQGILKCRSQPGEGTEFWIQIPVNCAVVEMAEQPRSNSSAAKIALVQATPTIDANGFIPSTTPILKPADLLTRHNQLIRRLEQHSSDVNTPTPDQIYSMFQRYPISLKLYATLLSWLYSANPTHISP
jgi:signal transduction histidine kinase